MICECFCLEKSTVFFMWTECLTYLGFQISHLKQLDFQETEASVVQTGGLLICKQRALSDQRDDQWISILGMEWKSMIIVIADRKTIQCVFWYKC